MHTSGDEVLSFFCPRQPHIVGLRLALGQEGGSQGELAQDLIKCVTIMFSITWTGPLGRKRCSILEVPSHLALRNHSLASWLFQNLHLHTPPTGSPPRSSRSKPILASVGSLSSGPPVFFSSQQHMWLFQKMGSQLAFNHEPP